MIPKRLFTLGMAAAVALAAVSTSGHARAATTLQLWHGWAGAYADPIAKV